MGYRKRTRAVPRGIGPGALSLAIMPVALGLIPAEELRAHAAETAGDVETDHIDAADDGGPRTWGLALRPVETSLGLAGVELGLAAAPRAVLTVEASALALAPTRAYGMVLGAALFPTRFAFHGFYVHPRVEWWRAGERVASREAMGAGALVGYEWTAPVGASLRLGAGAAYGTWLGANPSTAPVIPVTGLRPEVDAALGWVF